MIITITILQILLLLLYMFSLFIITIPADTPLPGAPRILHSYAPACQESGNQGFDASKGLQAAPG